VFENGILRRIFGPKRAEIIEDRRKLCNEEIRDLYSSSNIIRMIKSRRMRWSGHVARMGSKRNAYKHLVGNLDGWRPLGKPRCRWEDTMKMDSTQIELSSIDWSHLTQERDQ
jgi:hypothetical protein